MCHLGFVSLSFHPAQKDNQPPSMKNGKKGTQEKLTQVKEQTQYKLGGIQRIK